jgi:hemin uptake protein HemP
LTFQERAVQSGFEPQDDGSVSSLSPDEPGANTRRTPPRLDSRELLGDHPEIEIQHGSQVYRLRLTALGKLILTK